MLVTDSARPLLREKIVKAWRGYYAVALMDQASSLFGPIVMFDVAEDEMPAIIPLLSTLHQQLYELRQAGHLKDDFAVEELVGDSAWDEDEPCRLCLLDYGIDPIFRLHDPKGRGLGKGDTRDGQIKQITGAGQLVCQHGTKLRHGGLVRPDRAKLGLRPGQSSPEQQFRLRAGVPNPCGCGKVSVPAQLDWSSLVHHPHHPHGREDLYAYRQAALDTLQQIESGFNRLKTARKIFNGGEERTHLLELTSVHALAALAALAETAMVVIDQRRRHGTPLAHAVPASGTVAAGEGVGVAEAA